MLSHIYTINTFYILSDEAAQIYKTISFHFYICYLFLLSYLISGSTWVISFLFAIMLRDLTIEYVILYTIKKSHYVKALRDT